MLQKIMSVFNRSQNKKIQTRLLEKVEGMENGRVLIQAVLYRLKGIINLGRPCRRWKS